MATENVGVEPAQRGIKKPLFGPPKQPDLIVYQMIKKNKKLRDDTPMFPPYRRFPNTDIIKWEFKNDDGSSSLGTRAIRFLPGFGTIFVDEQEKDGRVIPDNVLNNPNNRFEIIDGQIKVRPHEKTKIQFLDMCNRNAGSSYRTGTVAPIFERYSEEIVIEKKSNFQNRQQEAIQKSFSASPEQIVFHAKYLNIATVDRKTQASRTEKAIITDYRQYAIDNPESFLKTFDDNDLKDKFYIEKAIENNVISVKIIPGKAVWVSSKEEICDITQGTTPVESLFNFSKLKAGEAMIERIRKL